jgi:hypothetical protein
VERCRFKLCRSNLSRWFGRVFNRLAASTSSPATCGEAVFPAFVKRFSDNGGLSGDTRAEKVGKVVSVGRPAVVAVFEKLEDAF